VLSLHRPLDTLLAPCTVIARFVIGDQTLTDRLLIKHSLERLPYTTRLSTILYGLVVVTVLHVLETKWRATDSAGLVNVRVLVKKQIASTCTSILSNPPDFLIKVNKAVNLVQMDCESNLRQIDPHSKSRCAGNANRLRIVLESF
jgi:hypothetical protein